MFPRAMVGPPGRKLSASAATLRKAGRLTMQAGEKSNRDEPTAPPQGFEVWRPRSLAQLIDSLSKVTTRDLRRRYVWRGQANVAWSFAPSLFRRIARFTGNVPTEPDMEAYETDLMSRAMGRGFYDDKSHASTYALLQHHGAATRLLDVSRDPMMALWFATENSTHDEVDAAVFAVDVTSSKHVDAAERPSWADLADPAHTGEPIVYYPPWLDERVKAQRAAFITTVLDGSQTDRMAFRVTDDRHVGICLVVLADIKVKARELLDRNFGLHVESMYPDIDGFAQANGPSRPFRVARDELLTWD